MTLDDLDQQAHDAWWQWHIEYLDDGDINFPAYDCRHKIPLLAYETYDIPRDHDAGWIEHDKTKGTYDAREYQLKYRAWLAHRTWMIACEKGVDAALLWKLTNG